MIFSWIQSISPGGCNEQSYCMKPLWFAEAWFLVCFFNPLENAKTVAFQVGYPQYERTL